ncbi:MULTISPECIES: hypothetical protein [unclassified Microbulbifer]|uniref:hypothetical protein n=1 Tax=unclassified Microbulbifer TaxID=2619833 RepID=UPI0027E47D4B|nr:MULTISPECIES: hypothetical protein [unclassified Microbulbifer]
MHGDIATPIVLPAPVEEFVLRQKSGGEFTLVTGLSSSQKSQAQKWPLADIEIKAGDFNIDGIVDIFLKGVTSSIPGALDQFVFASGEVGTAPSAITAVDSQFRQFFKEVNGWKLDPDYFEKTAIENDWYSYKGKEATGWWYIGYINVYYAYANGEKKYLDENDDPEDINNKPAYCKDFPSLCRFNMTYGFWQVYGTYIEDIEVVFDYTNFHQDALALTDAIENSSDSNSTLIDPSSTSGKTIEEILERILGTLIHKEGVTAVVLESTGTAEGPWIWESDDETVTRLPLGWINLILTTISVSGSSKLPECEIFYRGDISGKKEFWASIIEESIRAGESLLSAKNIAYDLLKDFSFEELATDHAQTSIGSPYISVTTNRATAGAYAELSDGEVYEIVLPEGMAKKNIYNHNSPNNHPELPDDEWLVLIHIPSWMVNNPYPGHCVRQ